MVKATNDVQRFIKAVEGLVQMHSGPVQPSGIAYEKAQMEYIAALLDVIVFSSHAPACRFHPGVLCSAEGGLRGVQRSTLRMS